MISAGWAKRYGRQGGILDALDGPLDRGAWVVGVEPSCVTVFHDELPNLFPDDPRARRLAGRTLVFAEFIDRPNSNLKWNLGDLRAVVHGHRRAIIGMEADEAVPRSVGIDAEILDSGCCGMAGAFGCETGKYEVSRRIAELVLLPRLRRTPAEIVVIADGFSCRTQIDHAFCPSGGRRAITLPEVLRDALPRPIRPPGAGL